MGNAKLRNAFIAHALALILAGLVIAAYMHCGNAQRSAVAFECVGTIAAGVLILWSLVFSIRAARSGTQWRWTALLWVLSPLEMLVTSAYVWSRIELFSSERFEFRLVATVVLPAIAITGLYVASAAGLVHWRMRCRTAIGLVALLYLPFIVVIVPSALYLSAVVGSDQYHFIGSPEDDVVQATPEIIRDGVDRVLAASGSGKLFDWHLLQCFKGRLSTQRCLENLRASVKSTNFETWRGLEFVDPPKLQQICVDCLLRRVPPAPRFRQEMAITVGQLASRSQLADVFTHIQLLDETERKELFAGIESRAALALSDVEWVLLHRIDTSQEFLSAFLAAIKNRSYENYVSAPNELRYSSPRVSIYRSWLRIKAEPPRPLLLKEMISRCSAEQDVNMRRIYATVLSDVLKKELHHVPCGEPLDTVSQATAVQPEESEELHELCIAAQAEIDKSIDNSKD